MDAKQRLEIKELIKKKIERLKRKIESYKEMTKPISPENSCAGRKAGAMKNKLKNAGINFKLSGSGQTVAVKIS